MRILVLGGTVFLGRHLVPAALSRGHAVTLFHRGRQGRELFPDVERIVGDRNRDLELLRGRRWDAAVDTCGYLPSAVRKSSLLLRGAVGHYTFVSSLSVFRDFSAPGMAEEGPLGTLTDSQLEEAESKDLSDPVVARNYGNLYGPLKALCERAAEESIPGRVLVVRPGLIVGPYDYSDRFGYWPLRVSRGGDVLAPGQRGRAIQLIDARDLAEWIVRSIEKGTTGVFNATGPDSVLTMERMLDECRIVTGSDARPVWIGERFLLDAGVEPWGELPLWLPEESRPEFRGFMAVDCSRARAAGLTFRPLVETIRDTLDWELGRPAGTERRAGLKREKEEQLLATWRAGMTGT